MRIREISNAKRGPCFGCKWIAYCLIVIISIVQKFSNQQTRYERLDLLNQQQCADLEIPWSSSIGGSRARILYFLLYFPLHYSSYKWPWSIKDSIVSIFDKTQRKASAFVFQIFLHNWGYILPWKMQTQTPIFTLKNTIFVTKMRRHKKGWIAFIEYRKRNQLNCVKDVPVQ